MALVVPAPCGGYRFAAGYYKATIVQAALTGLVELGPVVPAHDRPVYTGGGLRWADRDFTARTITLPSAVPPAPVRPVRVDGMAPGSEEWMAAMTASKIAAVMGLSSYDSRRSVWEKMAGNLPSEPPTKNKTRGHYLEGGVAAWWMDRHPEYAVLPGGTWQHPEDSWMVATPDRRLVPMCECDTHLAEGCCDAVDCDPCCSQCPTCPALDRAPVALLELKTDADGSEWGRGVDEIPVGIRCQVLWQMVVLGVREVHVAVLSSYLEMREYVITWDQEEIDALIAEAADFRLSLHYGEPPELDGDKHTYAALRRTHPHLDPKKEITLTDDQAREVLAAKKAEQEGLEHWNLARSRLTELMGDAGKAKWGEDVVAYRRARKGVMPWVETPKNLPPVEAIQPASDEPLDWGMGVAS
ncbi:YqaJ viral recombinase family protein [Nocardiopsis sp. CNR-923]|uniref:YqaJ viral recombinase family protein n=1 Tax=Nocardiopsis sp. CNR-923 TaxID=1904965 RepID=UPI00130170B2|nr:YqaJ viral recombinase family protein [Nocardiopsis sp. CNR-923]